MICALEAGFGIEDNRGRLKTVAGSAWRKKIAPNQTSESAISSQNFPTTRLHWRRTRTEKNREQNLLACRRCFILCSQKVETALENFFKHLAPPMYKIFVFLFLWWVCKIYSQLIGWAVL